MEDIIFDQEMREIVSLLAEASYDPYAQLSGYVASAGDDTYITRHGGARGRIVQLEFEKIKAYVERMANELPQSKH